MGGGRGGAGFRTGRKLAAADLQLVILALLAQRPSHGYELIKALEERSGGFYSPSPGMIYPALTFLDEIGYATVEAAGTKKLYRLTDAGRRHLDANRAVVEATLAELARIGGKMERVRRLFAGDEPSGDGEDDDLDPHRSDELHAARRALKLALRATSDGAPEEAKRIAEILRRAAAEILGK
ncbi:MAG: PadR family transcriptional regulator [Stellaceae bacterium]